MSARPRLGAIVFFGLVVAALAAAVLVVRARTPDLVLEVSSITRQFDPAAGDHARLRFFVRRSDDDAQVAIVDSHERVVRTLDQSVALAAGQSVGYAWDGSADGGDPAADGRYRLLVELPGSDREMIWPRPITLGQGAAGGSSS